MGPAYIVGDRRWWWGREGTHKAEILRAGAGAPRGLRRRNHNAERSWADYLWDYHLRDCPPTPPPPPSLRFETFFIDILVHSLRNESTTTEITRFPLFFFSIPVIIRGDSLPSVASRHLAMRGGTYSSDPCVCDPGNIPPWLMVMFKILLRRETGAAGRINDDSSSSSSSSSSLTAAPVAFSMNDRRRNVRSKSETYFCIDHVAMGRSIVADLPCNRNRSRAVSHVIPRF